MNEDVAKVMVAVKERIEKLEALLLGLAWLVDQALMPGGQNGEPAQRILATGPSRTGLTDGTERGTELVRRAVKKGRRNQQKKTKVTKGKSAPNGLGGRILAVLPASGAEFNGAWAHAALGDELVTVPQVCGQLRYLAKTGRLKLVTAGKPGKAATFRMRKGQKGGSPSPRPSPPGEGEPSRIDRAGLEKKRDQALKQRDAARASGRDSLVDMFQGEADEAGKQLAALGHHYA